MYNKQWNIKRKIEYWKRIIVDNHIWGFFLYSFWLKTLFNIVEAPLKKKLNFDLCAVNSQEYMTLWYFIVVIIVVNIYVWLFLNLGINTQKKISMTEYHQEPLLKKKVCVTYFGYANKPVYWWLIRDKIIFNKIKVLSRCCPLRYCLGWYVQSGLDHDPMRGLICRSTLAGTTPAQLRPNLSVSSNLVNKIACKHDIKNGFRSVMGHFRMILRMVLTFDILV